MKKTRKPASGPEASPPPDYDFSQGVRGKYLGRLGGGTLVSIPLELSSVFPTDSAVQKALRAYRDLRVQELIAQLRDKPPRARQTAIRSQLRRLGHRGGLATTG